MKNIRIETFDGKTRTISLLAAVKEFGKNELLEYLSGYCPSAAMFLVKDGADVYEPTINDLS